MRFQDYFKSIGAFAIMLVFAPIALAAAIFAIILVVLTAPLTIYSVIYGKHLKDPFERYFRGVGKCI